MTCKMKMTGTIRAFVSLLSLGFLMVGCLSQNPEASDSSCDIPLGTAKRFHNRMLELARREGLHCQMGAFQPLVIPESEGIWMPCGNVEWEFWHEGEELALSVVLVPKGESEEGKRLPDFEGLKVIVTHQYQDRTLPALKKTAQRALAFLQEPCNAPTNELSISPPDDHGLTMRSLQHFHQLMAEIIDSQELNQHPRFGCLFAGFPNLPADGFDLWQPQNDAQWSFFAKGNTNAALTVRLDPKGITPPDKCLFAFYDYDAVIHYSYEQEAGGDLALKKSVHELVEHIRKIEAERPAMLMAVYEQAIKQYQEQHPNNSQIFHLEDYGDEPAGEFITTFFQHHPQVRPSSQRERNSVCVAVSSVDWRNGTSNVVGLCCIETGSTSVNETMDFRAEKHGSEWCVAKPILTASILLPDGKVKNGYSEGYRLTQEHEGGIFSCGLGSELKWYRTDLESGAFTFTLETSNLTSEVITVNVQDDIATPSNIVFRMKAKSPAGPVQEKAQEPSPSIIRRLLLFP